MYIVLPRGTDIVDVILGEPGSKSDISQFREAQSKFSTRQRFRGDTGYQGEANLVTHHKRTKKRELMPEEKEENKAFAQKRICVEHVIRKIKIFRIAQQRFLLRGKRYPLVIEVICGLVRLRIGALVLPSTEKTPL
ncbi:hypothetical protein C7271_12385 [filamentous cyanobacterium CCP5]|nr:hypothetical protein C7271_12385 [filamentous cyanobacterium CCP5]